MVEIFVLGRKTVNSSNALAAAFEWDASSPGIRFCRALSEKKLSSPCPRGLNPWIRLWGQPTRKSLRSFTLISTNFSPDLKSAEAWKILRDRFEPMTREGVIQILDEFFGTKL
ncbi:hypothetical protein TNIN_253861 [Trichonephila inaurata madagascariensis]|uniref:Uncharacterized protein n=1 Tax=Trichonephila inaurata madagascariensis TaxID=2747483 RepID=A0A8X7CBY2_9ARAC|nr:hypothetical protein TNIN_253861 [Trichonephila inaurata madagascariensis]